MFIQEYRKEYGLSREGLGRLAKCSGELIYILESGGITHPGIADRITSVCDGGKNERNSIVDGSHWREGWKQIPRYRARGEKAEKAYFLRLAREKKEKELAGQMRAQAGQPTGGSNPQDMPRVAATAGNPSDNLTVADREGGRRSAEVYAINRVGEVVCRYPDCAAAARQYAVKPYTVESRCEHRVSKNTNEFFLSGVTFRYVEEWDRLSREAQQSMIAAAESRGGNRRRKPVAEEYSWQGQTRSMAEWARLAGMSRQTLRSRLARGWDIEKALKTPIQNREK